MKVPESAKQSRSRSPPSSESPGSTIESDHIGPTQKHKFQFRIQTSPITSIRLTSPVPVRVPVPPSSESPGVRQAVKVPVPPSSQGPGFRQAVKVPDPQLSPTTSVRLRNISSSSGSRRVRSHRSDSPVQFLSRSSFRSKNTSPFQIQPYESDPIDPTRFYSSVYGSKFQTGPRLITSVGGPIPGSKIHQVGSPQNKFRSEVRAGSSRTFPDDLP